METRGSLIRQNYIADPTYAPYCMRCEGLHRMKLVEPFLWNHPCGAVHDERSPQSDAAGVTK